VLASAAVVACAEKRQMADAHAYEMVVLERGNLSTAKQTDVWLIPVQVEVAAWPRAGQLDWW
jgi:hypothetical protein